MIYLLEVIFPYIVFFYLADCFIHVKSCQLAFRSHFGRKYGMKEPGIRFIGISPWCRLFYAFHLQLYCHGDSFYFWKKERVAEKDLYRCDNFASLRLDRTQKVFCQGRRILSGETLVAEMPSSAMAASLVRKIEVLTDTPLEDREKICQGFYTKPDTALGILAENSRMLTVLQALGLFQFICVFLLLPSALYLSAPLNIIRLLWVVAGVYCTTFGIAVYTHKRICRNPDRFWPFLFGLIFSPVNTIHAVHNITADLQYEFDWIDLAAVLLPPETFRDVLVKEMRRILLSLKTCSDPGLTAFLDRQKRRYRPYLDRFGMLEKDILTPPPRKDPTASGYCPLCETEYIAGVDDCPDCGICLAKYDDTGQ